MKKAFRLLSLLFLILCVSGLGACTLGRNRIMDGDKNVLERTLKLDDTGVWTLVVRDFRLASEAPDCFVSVAPGYGSAVKVATDDNVFNSLGIQIDRENHVVTVTGDPACTYRPSEFAIRFGSPVSVINLEGGFKLDAVVTGVAAFTLHAAGAIEGSVVFDRLEEFTVASQGASDLELEGRCATFMLQADGAAQIKAPKMEAEIANIKLSGACKADVNVTGELYAEASGACAVEVSGSPTVKQQAMSGVSELILK